MNSRLISLYQSRILSEKKIDKNGEYAVFINLLVDIFLDGRAGFT